MSGEGWGPGEGRGRRQGRGRGRGGEHRHGRGWGGSRHRRGDIRLVLLAALVDGSAHGYELMGRLEESSGGAWRPSPGSVYPTLQLLEDEGLVRSVQEGDRRVYELTDAGREQADPEVLAGLADDDERPGRGGYRALWDEVRQLHLAAKQVTVAGGNDQLERATTIVRDARQALYRMLGEE
jgi:DNA-binding PadR family transcriptional regulator